MFDGLRQANAWASGENARMGFQDSRYGGVSGRAASIGMPVDDRARLAELLWQTPAGIRGGR